MSDAGDTHPLAVVLAELAKIAGGRPLPEVVLTDEARSTARAARPWRAARIAIRRVVAAAGPSDGLRGELAHEYAHILNPETWRHLAFSLLASEIGAVGFVLWLAGAIAPWLDHTHALLWLGFWFVGMILMCAALWCSAWASHGRELRADALAAKLLGDVGPVLAMLDDGQGMYERVGRAARLCSLLTHPSPIRRRRELLRTGAEREAARAVREAVP